MGHRVIFITDAKPAQTINADETLYCNIESAYRPNWRDGHVWLQVDRGVALDIGLAFRKLDVDPDLVVVHDLHSYLGAVAEVDEGIFIQHESDVLTPGARYSFLSDEYLSEQINITATTSWRVGMTVHSTNIKPRRPVYTPVPFVPVKSVVEKTRGLLYIGDATERKGAREFMAMARALGVTPTVITHEPDALIFADAEVHTFGLDQRAAMYELMAQHSVAYIPSRNECPGIAALECLQFMPVVLDGEYAWTQYLDDAGAVRPTGAGILATIDNLLKSTTPYNPQLLDTWSRNSQQFWRNLST